MHLLDLLFTLIPAMVANMTSVVLARFRMFEISARPIDGGCMLGGQPIFGKHKTWRGLVGGVLAGLFVASVLLLEQWSTQVRLYLSLFWCCWRYASNPYSHLIR